MTIFKGQFGPSLFHPGLTRKFRPVVGSDAKRALVYGLRAQTAVLVGDELAAADRAQWAAHLARRAVSNGEIER